MSKQDDVKRMILRLASFVASGQYGTDNDIDAPYLVDDAEELLDDIKTTVGYGK